jgi:hypothetical protein
LLRASTFLNPDTGADLQLAEFYALRSQPGDLQRALRLALSVTRREPQNLAAWVSLLSSQRRLANTTGQRQALDQIRQLDPLVLKRRS